METAGMILRREREVRGLSLREISGVTRISVASLQAIEEDDFEQFSAEVFVRGFLRNYAKELQVSEAEILAAYDAQRFQRGALFAEAGTVEQDVVAAVEPRDPSLHRVEAVSSSPSFTESIPSILLGAGAEANASQRTDASPRSFKFAYILVVVIALASIGLSVAFTGTSEADESEALIMEPAQDQQTSPFLVSTTSQDDN